MRDVARVAASVLAGLAVLLGLACFALIIGEQDRDTRDGGIIVGSALLVVAGLLLLARRALRERDERPPEPTAAGGGGDVLVVRPSRTRFGLLLGVCLLFAAGSALLLGSDPAIAAGGMLLFGGFAVVFVLSLMPGRVFVRADRDGIFFRGVLRSHRWAWDEVENFRVVEIHHRYGRVRQVGFDLRHLTPERQTLKQTLDRGIAGADRMIPGNFEMPAEELAERLDELRERHATEHGPSPSALADRRLAEEAAAIPKDRVPAVTGLLALACAGVFAWQAAGAGFAPDAGELRDQGGATAGAAPWTLLWANLLHAHVVHLLLNLVALVVLGVLLEREVGWPRMALLALAGGVAAMGAAVALSGAAVTVGVSGIVFAISGWAIRRDVHRTRALGTLAWTSLPIGLVYTFFSPGTSLGAHLGGVLAGLLLGWAAERAPAGATSRDRVTTA